MFALRDTGHFLGTAGLGSPCLCHRLQQLLASRGCCALAVWAAGTGEMPFLTMFYVLAAPAAGDCHVWGHSPVEREVMSEAVPWRTGWGLGGKSVRDKDGQPACGEGGKETWT